MKAQNMLGVMVDCSRNAVLSLNGVKKYIDALAKMGYNTLMLYTEDTYEVEGEPFFGYLRGRYSAQELRAIDKYAAENKIELVPCIQTLAHLNAIFRWPEYRAINDVADILLAGDEGTEQFIEKMFKSLHSCVSTDKIHIGMDEAHMIGLGKYLDRHGFCNRTEILLKHLDKVCKICKKYGFSPMMWSDMFFRLANGGEYYRPIDDSRIDEIKSLIPENLTLVYWDYYNKSEDVYRSMLEAHKKLSDKVAFAGGVWTWAGYVTNNKYAFDVTQPAINVCREVGVNNVLLTSWGDNGGECSPMSALPALFYAAELYRGNSESDSIKKKFAEVFGEDFDLVVSQSEINIDFKNEKCHHSSKSILACDVLLGLYDTVIAEDSDAQFAAVSKKFSEASEKTQMFKLHFEALSSMADALSKKALLGVQLREAYSSGDRKALEELCSVKLPAASEAVRNFINAYRRLWLSEKKPHGFDVQEMRLGGVAARIDGAAVRVREYLDGKADSIPELEEAIYDISPFYNWNDSASTNIF